MTKKKGREEGEGRTRWSRRRKGERREEDGIGEGGRYDKGRERGEENEEERKGRGAEESEPDFRGRRFLWEN